MHTRATAATAAAVLLLTLSACGKTDAQKQADCAQAIDSASTVTNRPDACAAVPTADYKTLLISYTIKEQGLAP